MKKINKLVILASSLSVFSLASSCNQTASRENDKNKVEKETISTINLIFKNIDNNEVILNKQISKTDLENKNLIEYFNNNNYESANKINFNEKSIVFYLKKINKTELKITFNGKVYKYSVKNDLIEIQNQLQKFKLEHNIDSNFSINMQEENNYIIERKVDQNTYLTLRDIDTNNDLFSIKLVNSDLSNIDIKKFIPNNFDLVSTNLELTLNKDNIINVKSKTFVDITIIYNDVNHLINNVENKDGIIQEKISIFMNENNLTPNNYDVIKISDNKFRITPKEKITILTFIDQNNKVITTIEKTTYGSETFDFKGFIPKKYELVNKDTIINFGEKNRIQLSLISEENNSIDETEDGNAVDEVDENNGEEDNTPSHVEEEFETIVNFAKKSPELVINGTLTSEDFDSIVSRYETNTTDTYRKMIYKDINTFGFTKTLGWLTSFNFNPEISEMINFNLGNDDEEEYIVFSNVDKIEKSGTYKGGTFFNFELDKENRTIDIIGKFTLIQNNNITKQSDLFRFKIAAESIENVDNTGGDSKIDNNENVEQTQTIDQKYNKLLELIKQENFKIFEPTLSEQDYEQFSKRYAGGKTETYRRMYYKDIDVFGFTKTIGQTSSVKFNNQIKDFISKNLANEQNEYIVFSNVDQIENRGTYSGGTFFNFEVNTSEQTVKFVGKFCLVKDNKIVQSSDTIEVILNLNNNLTDDSTNNNSTETTLEKNNDESLDSKSTTEERTNNTFRIGHWNVLNYGIDQANFKSDGIAKIISHANMDIVGLTEINANRESSVNFIVDKLNEINPGAAYKFYVQPIEEASLNSQPTQVEQIAIIYKSSIFEPTSFSNGKIGDSFNPEVENYIDPSIKQHYVRTPYGMKFLNKLTNKNITVVYNHLDSPGAKTKAGEISVSKTKDPKKLVKGDSQGSFELTEAYGLINVMNYFDQIDGESSLLFGGDTNIKLNNIQVFKPMFDNGYLSVYGDSEEKHKTSLGRSNLWSQPYDKIFIKEAQSTNFITEQENPEIQFKYDIYAAINAKIITDFKNNDGDISSKANSISDHTLTWVDWEN